MKRPAHVVPCAWCVALALLLQPDQPAALFVRIQAHEGQPASTLTLIDDDDVEYGEEVEDAAADRSDDRMLKSAGPGVVYGHLAKSGGSSLRNILSRVLPHGNFSARTEFDYVNSSDTNHFTIGSIRNPCDFYVSYWAYRATDPELHDYERKSYTKVDFTRDKSTPHEIALFREWTRSIMNDDSVGLFSARFAKQYGNTTGALPAYKLLKTTAELPAGIAPQLRHALDYFEPSAINCWVHTENMMPELRSCLQQYEDQTGAEVEWSKFNNIAAHIEEKHHEASQSDGYKGTSNDGSHGSCELYYDTSMAAFIRAKDQNLFDKFGYNSCCGGASA